MSESVSFSTARRSTIHVTGNTTGEYVPHYRVIAPCVIVKCQDGRLEYCFSDDTCDWLNDQQKAHFLRLGLVVEIPDSDSIPDTLAVRAH
jgi:hypothetical protein